MAESIPFFDPGDAVTAHALTAVAGARFVTVTANRLNGLIRVGYPAAGGAVFGISAHDAAAGETVGVHHQPAIITEVTAGAALTAGGLVQSDATGQAIPRTTGVIVGMAVDDAALGAKAVIDRSVRG